MPQKSTPSQERAAALWTYRGGARPPFADEPGPGQESVWDYPRPPGIVADRRLIEVRAGSKILARSARALRVLETASPPTFYLPQQDVREDLLSRAGGSSFCEWKGRATYFDLQDGKRHVAAVAWAYEHPPEVFAEIAGYFAFYPGRVDCFVDGERVRPQAGGFYGGWVTDEIVGPFKGDRGTGGW